MKLLPTLLALLALAVSPLAAENRTWTSADGAKTFDGSLKSYDSDSAVVTVIRSNGRAVSFPLDLLSETDRDFVQSWSEENPAAVPEEEMSVVHKKVRAAKLHRLDGDDFEEAELDKNPEYFILYYSASW